MGKRPDPESDRDKKPAVEGSAPAGADEQGTEAPDRRARVRLFPIPPNTPDPRGLTPEEEEARRQGVEALDKMAAAMDEGLVSIAKRKLTAGAFAWAVLTDGVNGEKKTAFEVAVMLKMCDEHAPRSDRMQASQRIRNLKRDVAIRYSCSWNHGGCSGGPCALQRGRQLITALEVRTLGSVTSAELARADDIIGAYP